MRNSLLSVFQTVVGRKLVLGLATFIVLAAGAFVLQPANAAHAASNCQYYTVVPGDTLSQIASNYQSDVQSIADANNVANVNLIFPGQQFCIPVANGGTQSVAQIAAQPAQVAQPIPAAAPSNTGYVSGSVADMINQVFGPYAGQALSVANCESGLNPGAYNPISIGGSNAAGVFQILYPSTWAGTSQAGNSPYDARANIIAAHEIFVRDGYSWSEWVCR